MSRSTVIAACKPCYQCAQQCTDGSMVCNTPPCPVPHPYTFKPDYWLACAPGSPGCPVGYPTVVPQDCPGGTYACHVNSVPRFCCSAAPPPTTNNPPPTPVGCTPSCGGGSCGFSNDGCGGSCGCNECELCTLKCGQAKDCGGNCTNTDSGVPGIVFIVTPKWICW